MNNIKKFEDFNNLNEGKEDGVFILIKDIGKLKKGKKFDSFGGLVSAVVVEVDDKNKTIRFDDKEYFKLKD